MHDGCYGRMNDPSGAAVVTGPCGDTMEFYLVIQSLTITQVRYYTDGCQYTRLCGKAVARHAQGKPLTVALDISAGQILKELPQLPKAHRHCAILAVSTFYRAVGQYWVVQANS
ncbi:iron-sulfur cluster assembly scaffold protein [Planctomycetota bacterium]